MMKLFIRFLLLGSLIANTSALCMHWPLSFRTVCFPYISQEIILNLIAEYISLCQTKLAIIGDQGFPYSFVDFDVHRAASIEAFKQRALRDVAQACNRPVGYCRILEKRNGVEADPTALFWDKHRTDNDCLIIQMKNPIYHPSLKKLTDKPPRIPLPQPKLKTIHEEA